MKFMRQNKAVEASDNELQAGQLGGSLAADDGRLCILSSDLDSWLGDPTLTICCQ